MPGMAAPRRGSEPLNIQLLVDSIPALIHTSLPDGYLDYFNKPWLEYLGVALDKVVGWSWTGFIHPEDLDGIVAEWRGCLASGEIFEYETRVRRADGEYRWMFHRKVPLRDGRGSIVKWYGSSLDIEERKTTEEQLRRNTDALQRSEFYLAEGQRLGHMGSWAFDAAGFSYWSPELFRMHGLEPAGQAPSVQEYLGLVHPQDQRAMAELINRLVAEDTPFDATKRIVRPDGEVRYIRCAGVPFLDSRSLKKYVGSAIDVTEQELLTQELRRREAYLAEAQRMSHTGSWAWNVGSGALFWSQEIFRIYGYNPDETGPTWEQFLARVHPEDRAQIEQRAKIETSRKEWVDSLGDFRIVLPNGTIKHLHSVAHPGKDGSGEITEIIGTVMDVTEHELLTRELRRREAYLAEAQRLSHTGSFGWKVSSGELFWSDETFRIFEYDRSVKPTLDSLVQRVHPEDRADFEEVTNRALAGAPEFEHAYRLLLPDGRVKHVRALAHVLHDASGNPEFLGAVTDVTEHMTAQEALRSSEADLLEAQRLSHMGSWRNDVLTGIVTVSPEVHRIFDIRPGEDASTAEFFFGRIHAEDRPIEAQIYERANVAKTDFESDYRIVLPDGSIKYVHNIGHPVLNETGDIREFVGTVIDITEQRRAEAVIREQEAEFRQIVDLAPQLVGVYGPELERLYCNRMALDYQGVSLDEWRQMKRGGLVHPDDSEQLKTSWDHALASGSTHEVELRQRKHDGSYRWFVTRYHPVRDEKGQITRWYVTATDIDDRRQAEERLRQENVALREEIDKASMFEEIVGASPALHAVLSRVSKVAPTDSTVLITGETGTGKELVARAIHRRSRRSSRAFVSVNCAAIPRDLIASELFGHEKGSFTGALQRRVGRFELAEGGTIFLDEIGELPTETQIALLRVLQEREFDRVGGNHPIRADVRVIAATNRDLEAAVGAGSFRGDLFYRINVFPIENPPLRKRKDDIPVLVEYFIDRYARKAGKNIKRVNKKTLELFQSYPWPGNIRELQNVIERSVILCDTEIFSIDENWLAQAPPLPADAKQQDELPQTLLAQEKNMIEAALKESHGRVFGPSGAAAKLGVPRSTLESKIRSLHINKNRFKN
jgi:PAS domain S-box-containing protein